MSKLYLELALFLHLPSEFELQRGVKDCKFQNHTKNSKWPEMKVQNRKKNKQLLGKMQTGRANLLHAVFRNKILFGHKNQNVA
jgi:hypothetical protein